MTFVTDSFRSVEALFERHAPLLLRIGGNEPLREPVARATFHYRPAIPQSTIARMKRLRADGETIGDIARTCRVSWNTAWKHSKVRP